MKCRLPVAVLMMAASVASQQAPGRKPSVARAAAEQQDLDRALAAAGASPVEYLRAIEEHLAKYPDTARRAELEGAAARAAIEAGDNRAIIEYGERVLARRPDDFQILQAVSSALLAADSRDAWQRALRYAGRSEALLRQQADQTAHSGRAPAELRDRIDRDLAKALENEARATGSLGQPVEALALAVRSFETFPNAESAREIARWDERLGQPLAAARALADAMTVPDEHATMDNRARDRARMGELYRSAKGSDAGLGDLLIQAFDRNLALVRTRQLRLRVDDPNAGKADPMEFILAGLNGGKLSLAGLKGEVVVLDFWATWCVPCREQHPLLEQVQKRFASHPDVVFLSIDTDQEHGPVRGFLEQAHWNDRVYFEDGLSRALSVMSIPTTIVFGRDGKVFSRLTGFEAAQFAATLGQRIADALAAP